jgi:ligand-binding SRPBCC domain-containing protein
MTTQHEFTIASELGEAAEAVWQHATSPAGVNAELMPLARMTWPSHIERLTAETVTPGTRLCRSWILFLGVLPVDYDEIVFAEFGPGLRFLERSRMLTQCLWEHERTVQPCGAGCRVVDRVRFVPRLATLGILQAPIFRLAFRLRHHNLRRRFGAR